MKAKSTRKNERKEHLSKTEMKDIVKLFFVAAKDIVVNLLVLSLIGITELFCLFIYMIFYYSGFDETTSIINTVVISILLVLTLIVSLTIKEFYRERESKRVEEWNRKNIEFQENENKKNYEYQQKLNYIREFERNINQKKVEIEKIIGSETQNYPWMATMFADYEYVYDKHIAHEMENKSHPAISSAQKLKVIAKEKRDLNILRKLYEYQLNYYENIFPWLEEFKEIEPKMAWEIVQNTNEDASDEYEKVKNWLSPDDWKNLPSDKKWQLALDRYIQKRKSNWEVGIDYERYVGFTLEKQGYRVKYQGALFGLEDMGRDLIAYKENEILVIQCKRWAKEKTIHEKYIFQLYGSVVLMQTEQLASDRETQLNIFNLFDDCSMQPLYKIKGVFITTIQLSDVAKKCAEFLNIRVIENFAFDSYPRIKCNNSTLNGKIYHLPFDQQYDRVQINPNDGDCYVSTTIEAEKLGYRHAYRWQGDRESN